MKHENNALFLCAFLWGGDGGHEKAILLGFLGNGLTLHLIDRVYHNGVDPGRLRLRQIQNSAASDQSRDVTCSCPAITLYS